MFRLMLAGKFQILGMGDGISSSHLPSLPSTPPVTHSTTRPTVPNDVPPHDQPQLEQTTKTSGDQSRVTHQSTLNLEVLKAAETLVDNGDVPTHSQIEEIMHMSGVLDKFLDMPSLPKPLETMTLNVGQGG